MNNENVMTEKQEEVFTIEDLKGGTPALLNNTKQINKLNIKKLISIIEPKNISSIKVARRIGMKKAKSAKFYEFNVDIYEIKN